MEYTKKMLIKEAIRKLENLDEILKDCLEVINSACEQRKLIRYLLWLGFENEEQKILLE